MSYYEFLITFQASQGLAILAAVFLKLNKSKISLFFLAILLINFFFLSFSCFLYLNYGPAMLIQLKGMSALSIIALGPLLYFYIKSDSVSTFQFSSKDQKHLFPFLIAFTLILLTVSMEDEQRFIDMYSPIRFDIINLFRLLGLSTLFLYIVKSYQFVTLYQRNLSEISSLPSAISMPRYFGMIFLVSGTFILGSVLTLIGMNDIVMTLGMEFIVVGFLALSVFSHSQSKAFQFDQEDLELLRYKQEESDSKNATDPLEKYKNSPLDEEQLEIGQKKIQTLLEQDDQAFYNPNFRLSHLAKLIRMPTYLTSQVINQGMDKSFYDLVNEQRIKKAQRLLSTPSNEDLSILAVAYEVGYNSKSAFNTAFKKYTKRTPSEFRKAQDSVLTPLH